MSFRVPRKYFLPGIVSIVFMIVTIVPYIYGWVVSGEDRYVWTHSLTTGDFFIYYSYINQLADGAWLPVNLYTQEVTTGIVQPAWVIPALLVRWTGIGADVAFHIFRLALIPVFVMLMWKMLLLILPPARRAFQLVFLLTSSGVGIFSVLFIPAELVPPGRFSWPHDLWVPESNTFLTLYHTPHILLSTILLLAVFYFSMQYMAKQQARSVVWVGVTAFFLLWIHPFYILTLVAVLGGYGVVRILQRDKKRRRIIVLLFVIVAASIPPLVYYALLLMGDVGFARKATQNILLTSPVYAFILGYGGLFVLSVIAIWRRDWMTRPFKTFIVVWALVGTAIVYAPFDFQRRLLEGLHIPLVILSLYVLVPWISSKSRTTQSLLIGGTLLFFALTNISIVANDVNLARSHQYGIMLPAQEFSAAEWLQANAVPRSLVFAPTLVSRWLPAYAGVRIIVGHGVETLYTSEKVERVRTFYESHGTEGLSPAREADIIWIDDEETRQNLLDEGLDEVYSADGISLFRTEGVTE